MELGNRFAGGIIDIAWQEANGSHHRLKTGAICAELGSVSVRRVLDRRDCLTVTIESSAPITLQHCQWSGRVPVQPDAKIFANGYQSWSQSRESSLWGRTKGMGWLGKIVESRHHLSAYGDYNFGPKQGGLGAFVGWSWLSLRAGDTWELYGSGSEDVGFTALKLQCSALSLLRTLLHRRGLVPARLQLSRDVQGLAVAAGTCLKVLDVGFFQGSGEQVFDQWFTVQGRPARPATPCSGWTSWYKHYEDISEAKILGALYSWAAARTQNESKIDNNSTIKVVGTVPRWLRLLSNFQIDDGWQTAVGDWQTIRKDRFPSGMKVLANKIRQTGFRPGIWLAPFAAVPGSQLAKDHPDWIVKDQAGKPLLCGTNWGGFYALDLDIPEVKIWLRQVFQMILDDWGFDLVKLDFLYALCMEPRHGKSRGQLMAEGMEFIRECVGAHQVLACGVPLAAAFGRVEYCRIGCDVGLDWDDSWLYRHLHKERVSTKNALDNTWGRRMLNGRAFLNDPDVWIGRDDPKVRLTAAQKALLHQSNLKYGGLVFTSDDWDEIPAEWKKGVD